MLVFIVIIPVYNSEIFIHDCVNSVLNQSYQSFHIVLVDDGSFDSSGKICDELGKNDNRIHVIHQLNEGQLSARLAGLKFVSESLSFEDSYIVHLDSDDQLVSNALEVLKDVITYSECDIVIFTMKGKKDNVIIEDIGWTNIYEGLVTERKRIYSIILNDNKYNSLCCKAISATLIPYNKLDNFSNLYSIRHGEDLIQSLMFLENCKKVLFIKDKLYIYTYNINSITHKDESISSIIDSKGQKYVWDFIKNQRVWDEKDFEEYILYCCQLLRTKIIRIISYKSKKDILDALKTVQSDEYYRMLFESSKKKEYYLSLLFENKLYKLLFVGKVRKLLAKFKYIYFRSKY